MWMVPSQCLAVLGAVFATVQTSGPCRRILWFGVFSAGRSHVDGPPQETPLARHAIYAFLLDRYDEQLVPVPESRTTVRTAHEHSALGQVAAGSTA
jgi:hypothetical protein